MSNPFDDVYSALWSLPLLHPDFEELVRPGNRIRFDGPNRDPVKDAVATSDLPELTLFTEGLSAMLCNTSSTSKVVRRYTWALASGDLRLATLHAVEWALFVSMLRWRDVLTALIYEGSHFVKRADFTSVVEGRSTSEQNRNIAGWSALWRCEVEMHFPTNKLLEELT